MRKIAMYPSDEKDSATADKCPIIYLSGKKAMGTHRHRVLEGPKIIRKFWVRTRMENKKNGEVKPSNFSVIVSNKWNFIDDIVKIEREASDSTFAPPVTPQTFWSYLVINRAVSDSVSLAIAEYPRKVGIEINEKSLMRSTDNPRMLMYGPMYFWDAIITKFKQSDRTNFPDYRVDVHPSPEYMDNLEADIYKPGYELTEEKMKEIFTEDELTAMEKFKFNLDTETTPLTDNELIEVLQQNPLDLMAKNFSRPLITQKEKVKEILQAQGVPFFDEEI